MKTSKRIVSFLLSAIMVVTTFLAVGPVFTIEAEAADITIGGITQTHVVSGYEELYKTYQAKYFGGSETNGPTEIVIPGLSQTDNYIPQGMTYWPAKEWILISAYHKGGTNHSVIYAIDIVSGDFVALFKILDANGNPNTSHGGGIAASEYNFYYADTDASSDTGSRISYWPLSDMDVEPGTVKTVKIKDSINCSGELLGGKHGKNSENTTTHSAATSYCCYDEGVLWTGNFFYRDSNDYLQYSYTANSAYNSMVLGYRLKGNSSEEEWHNLQDGNLLNQKYLGKRAETDLTKTATNKDGTVTAKGTWNYSLAIDNNGYFDISGYITPEFGTTEYTDEFATIYLEEGKTYKIEFIADNKQTDMYMFAPNGKHSNIRGNGSYINATDIGDGKYKYSATFTPGVRFSDDTGWNGADGTYTGDYRIRFDQDSVSANSNFAITDIHLVEVDATYGASQSMDCAGNPTYCIGIDNSVNQIQYAMVDKGKIYISRSWGRTGNSKDLIVGDMDINVPGSVSMTVNGQSRKGYEIKSSQMTKFSGDKMLYMSEALCIIEDYLYMFGEGAAYNYMNSGDGKGNSKEPIDVIWKIDQHAIMNNPRSSTEDIEASHYEKVTDLSQLTSGDEYLVVYESSVKDRVSQKNILYLLDSYGGYGENKLPKNDNPTKDNTGDSIGVVGYKITSYTTDGNKLYIDDLDDARKSIRWKVTHNGSGANLRLENMDHYYGQHKYFNFNSRVMAMSTASSTDITNNYLNLMSVPDKAGLFYIYSTLGQVSGKYPYYLWCNDGSNPNPNVNYIEKYTDYYKNHPALSYTPPYDGLDETAGTFHTDALLQDTQYGGNMLGEEIYTYELAEFSFYKRVPDPHAYTGDSQVYTDLKAEVQSDGTLNLNLETYATASLHYKTLSADALAKRPMDYIFVVDTSDSMKATFLSSGQFKDREDSEVTMKEIMENNNDHFDSGSNNKIVWDKHNGIYIRAKVSGNYKELYGTLKTTNRSTNWLGILNGIEQLFWVYYTDDDGLIYLLKDYDNGTNTISDGISRATFESYVNNATGKSEPSRTDHSTQTGSKGDRSKEVIYYGKTYSANGSNNRLDATKNTIVRMTHLIQEDAKTNNLDHRVAVCNFSGTPGSSIDGQLTDYTGFFTNNSTSRTSCVYGYKTQTGYDKAFFSTSQFETLRRDIIDKLGYNGSSDVSYGMYMADQMIESSVSAGNDYTFNGKRNACIIVFTDTGFTTQEGSNTLAESTAKSAAHYCKKAKQLGASVYVCQVGSSNISNFDAASYIEYLSMAYIDAGFLSDGKTFSSGDHNPHADNVDYTGSMSSSATSTLSEITEAQKWNSFVRENAKYALAKLDANSVLREQLDQKSFSFENVSASDITIGTQKAYYDAIGRLQFEETQPDSTITADTSQANNGLITITGFDYSKNYVSTVTADDGTAKKLVITIKNVDFADDVVNMTDINRPIVDVPVSLADPTGIYMKNGEKHRSFPEDRVTIPQYTYVFDYGLGMLDVDINGTLVSVDTALQKQSTYSDSKTQGNTSLTFTEDRQDMTYTINKDATDMQRYFVLIQRPNGEYDWFAINIVPATNVYFEQDIFAVSNTAKATWNPVGSTQFTNQSISLWDDIYGFDENYLADNSDYSQGAALKTTVTSSNNRSDTMKTTFNGYGFDLYSVCGPTTGIQIIAIRDTTQPKQSNGQYPLVKSYVVDTFYNDTNYPGPLYQVPIVRFEGAYKKYEVEITSAYLSIAGALQSQSVESAVIDENGTISYTSDFTNDKESAILKQLGFEELIGTDVEFIWHSEDSVLNGGKGAQGVDEGSFTTQAVTSLENYIDGIRVYHPGGDNMDTYYKDSEKGAKYYNVFDNMRPGSFSGSGISYIYGTQGGQEFKFAEEFEKLFEGRPKNEVYLENSGNNSITFTVDNLDENSRVMISLRAAQGSPKAQVNNKVFVDGSITRMEMYYDITEYLTIADGKATVIIKNAGSGLLAVDNIKVTGAGGISAQSELPDVFEIFSLDVVEVDPRQPSISTSGDIGEIPLPPVPDQPDNNEPDDGNDNILPPSDDDNPEEPAEDGFFAKVESFFVKIFNFFKNIFNKVSTFFKF